MDDTKELSSKNDKISIENTFKVVQLAVEFTKNGKELSKTAEEDNKKSNYSKLVKTVKKIVPFGVLSKIMKLNATEIDRRRLNSLQEFVYIVEKLKQRIVNAKEQDPRMADDIEQFVQEGHMILAAVILNEIHIILSVFGADNTSLSRINLHRLLSDVKNYCDSVNTMKFPPEWENVMLDLSKKGVTATPTTNTPTTATVPTTANAQKKKVSVNFGQELLRDEQDATHKSATTKARSREDSLSEKEESDKEDPSEEDANETHTVQIEIRGNTGGFVGSTIEFDLVVTHEDGSPVKVHASDFAVEIHGPATSSPVVITAKGKDDGSFRIEFIPKEAGANSLSIFMHNTLLTSGIKSIISRAGETAFLIHTKDISRGQLQGISVIPTVPSNGKPRTQVDVLNQKLEDIATALQLLENLKASTLTEIQNLSVQNDT